MIGSAAEFTITPAITPLAFDSTTTATWGGEVLVNNVTGPTITVTFDALQVLERSADTADVLVGDGSISQMLTNTAIINNIGVTHGRMVFNFGGHAVKTQSFDFDHQIPEQFGLLSIAYDPHDPLGVESDFGGPAGVDVAHVDSTSDPQLETLLSYHRVLEVKIAENPETVSNSPASFRVKLVLLDDMGTVIQTIQNITMTKYANDGDPNTISYRSPLAQPFILIDTPVNDATFPDFSIITIPATGGQLAVVKS